MKSENHPQNPILIVDDEESILLAMDTILRMTGYENIIACQDSRQVMGLIARHHAETILMDLTMPHMDGLELLSGITENYPDIPVIIVTVADTTDTAVQCIKHGAFDYLVKPVETQRLTSAIAKAIEFRDLQRKQIDLQNYLPPGDVGCAKRSSNIITRNRKMHAIFKYIDAIATTSHAVLITGETGVGKELIAKKIHMKSGRPGPFITVNTAGLDDNVFSDTLFGHVKGAFTGADSHRRGLIDEASGGTLLLDEIGSLSMSSQVKLLRLLQEFEYRPLGKDKTRKADVRIIAATNENLHILQQAGKFRKDLLFRLLFHHIHIPPLRERMEDIPLLADHFFELAARNLDRRKVTYPRELSAFLQAYSFPGNVRELQAMIFDAVSRHQKGILSMTSIEEYIAKRRRISAGNCVTAAEDAIVFPQMLPTIDEAAQALLTEALKRTRGNQSNAARLLGISQQAVNKRLKKMEGIGLGSIGIGKLLGEEQKA